LTCDVQVETFKPMKIIFVAAAHWARWR